MPPRGTHVRVLPPTPRDSRPTPQAVGLPGGGPRFALPQRTGVVRPSVWPEGTPRWAMACVAPRDVGSQDRQPAVGERWHAGGRGVVNTNRLRLALGAVRFRNGVPICSPSRGIPSRGGRPARGHRVSVVESDHARRTPGGDLDPNPHGNPGRGRFHTQKLIHRAGGKERAGGPFRADPPTHTRQGTQARCSPMWMG